MKILGVSAFYHDSAACLVADGEVVAAAQEERFTRVKHDHRFPLHAVAYCLAEGGIRADEVDLVAFYDKPFTKFERLLDTYMAYAPEGFASFLRAMPLWLKKKLRTDRQLDRGLDRLYRGSYLYADHHLSHAASAFYPSPFERAACLTMDGVGEWSTTTWGVGSGADLHLREEIRFPHSLGLLYSAFTYHLGFKVNSGEYKAMGLAPYGEPRYADLIREHLVDLRDDGSFALDMRYFTYCAGLRMTGDRFDRLIGWKPRDPEAPLEQRHMDLARSIQEVTEEAMLRMARHVHARTGERNLCLAGGVALNCVGNGRILREGPFENVFVQPAAGDAGGAMGAALHAWHGPLRRPRTVRSPDALRGSLLGPAPDDAEAAAAVEAEEAGEWFDLRQESPYMLPVAPVAARRRVPVPAGHGKSGIALLDVPLSEIPAVTHVDGSAPVQTVDAARHPDFHALLRAWHERTGCPVRSTRRSMSAASPSSAPPPTPSGTPAAPTWTCSPWAPSSWRRRGIRPTRPPWRRTGAASPPIDRPLEPSPPPLDPLHDRDREDAPHRVRAFGRVALLVAPALWALVRFAWAAPRAAWWVGGAVLLWGGLSFLLPGPMGPVMRAWARATRPVGIVMTATLLGIVYYLVLTPVALLRRAIRPDPLERVPRRGAGPSCWREKRLPPPESPRWYRPF